MDDLIDFRFRKWRGNRFSPEADCKTAQHCECEEDSKHSQHNRNIAIEDIQPRLYKVVYFRGPTVHYQYPIPLAWKLRDDDIDNTNVICNDNYLTSVLSFIGDCIEFKFINADIIVAYYDQWLLSIGDGCEYPIVKNKKYKILTIEGVINRYLFVAHETNQFLMIKLLFRGKYPLTKEDIYYLDMGFIWAFCKFVDGTLFFDHRWQPR